MPCSVSKLALPAALLAIVGCAAAGAGGGAGGSNYYRTLGQATPGDLARKVRMIVVNKYHYQMEREDSSRTQQLYQTLWYGRYPFQDEIDSGVVAAETRITVRGRARGAGGVGVISTRVVEFTAENRVRIGDTGEWRLGFMTPMYHEYIDEIAQRLKTELEQSIRNY
jgi:hypothetical protein